MLSLSTAPWTPFSLFSSSSFTRPSYYHYSDNVDATPLCFKSLLLNTKQCLTKIRPNSALHSTNTTNQQPALTDQERDDDDDYQVLSCTRTQYNNIVILQSRKSKVLLLDDTGNVHSIQHKDQIWTNSYWDENSSLPAIIPQGQQPVAIFGLAGGTVAHQLLEFWPSLRIDGWELDEILVDRARQFFGLEALEKGNEFGGSLRVCIGDALDSSACVEGGYAGIIVDLFSDGKVLPQMEKAETWVEMGKKLMPGGRIMVNCGDANCECDDEEASGWKVNLTIKTLCEAFGDQMVNWKKMPKSEGGNYMALTGPMPDLKTWSATVPEKLRSGVLQWSQCQPSTTTNPVRPLFRLRMPDRRTYHSGEGRTLRGG